MELGEVYKIYGTEGKLDLKKLDKAIPVTGRGGSWGFEMSSLKHFLYNRLTDGGEVVSAVHPLLQENSWC
jgi:hypothetical protein